jgi:hypothetical protein
MLRHITAFTLILSLVSPALAWWPAPAGWRAESFPLPPPFAPTMNHAGSLEVRFPPGFAKPADARFFTYAFAWAIRCPDRMRPAQLAAELKTYYDGLVTTYGNPDPSAPFTGTQVEVECGEGAFHAVVETHDPFFTHAPLKLTIRVREVPGVAGHRTWLFLASPRPEDPSVRAAFGEVEAQLQVGR